jgi:hypothetical protein
MLGHQEDRLLRNRLQLGAMILAIRKYYCLGAGLCESPRALFCQK